jgi:acetyl esterase
VTHYVTGAFPTAFISSGNGDPLAPQAVALARRLEELGVKVDSLFFPAHEYQFDLDIPAGQQALGRMLAFIGAIVQPQ